MCTLLPEEQGDYESFVSDIRKDFEMKIETVQRSAEDNTKAYEVYCTELKAQLQTTLSANQDLEELCEKLRCQLTDCLKEKGNLQEQLSEMTVYKAACASQRSVVELLSAMTCLTISRVSTENNRVTCSCTVNDGKCKGHQFHLSLDKSSWEYTYTPVTTATVLDNSFNLNSTMCFPDYMISRFLANLMELTHLTD